MSNMTKILSIWSCMCIQNFLLHKMTHKIWGKNDLYGRKQRHICRDQKFPWLPVTRTGHGKYVVVFSRVDHCSLKFYTSFCRGENSEYTGSNQKYFCHIRHENYYRTIFFSLVTVLWSRRALVLTLIKDYG